MGLGSGVKIQGSPLVILYRLEIFFCLIEAFRRDWGVQSFLLSFYFSRRSMHNETCDSLFGEEVHKTCMLIPLQLSTIHYSLSALLHRSRAKDAYRDSPTYDNGAHIQCYSRTPREGVMVCSDKLRSLVSSPGDVGSPMNVSIWGSGVTEAGE
jgi:hypothetical protein